MKAWYLFFGMLFLGIIFVSSGIESGAGVFVVLGLIPLAITAYIGYLVISELPFVRKPKLKAQDKAAYERDKANAGLEFDDKARFQITERLRELREGAEAMRRLSTMMNESVYQEKPKNWAVLGGIADGIAGPGAGVATAMQAQRDNVGIEARNAARREQMAASTAAMYSNSFNADRQAAAVQESLSRPIGLQYSPTGAEAGIFRKLSVSAEFDYTEAGSLIISAKAKCGEKLTLGGKPAQIEGSLYARVYLDDTLVGDAYFPLKPLADKEQTFKGICPFVNKKDNYRVEILPYKLWLQSES